MTLPDYTEIDIEQWARKQPFQLFRKKSNPHFIVTADIEVTRLITDVKPTGVSLFNAVLYAIMVSTNSIAEFRTRFKNDKVYQYDVTDPSFTVPIQGTQFAFCEAPYSEDWEIFNQACNDAIQQARSQTELNENAASDHWTWLTCAPWLHFSSMSHPHDGADDCIPRIAWGRFTQRGEQWFMPLNVQAHHSLADGYHASQLFIKTEAILREQSFGN